MADSILKLKVQSEEYDAKLRKAAEGIRHLAEVAHRGAGELTGLDQSELDFIRSLGEMETKSRTAAGSVRELESAYKELKVVYDNLNDVEKKDEGGKALAASLDRIKERAQEARAQLDSASRSLQDNNQIAQQAGGSLGSLNDIFGMSITKLAGWGTAIAAAKGALDVAKDAFFASEQNIDSWGQAVEAGQAVYESFLTSINSGDISGFLSRISQITNAAIEAYNALDQLSTQKTIQSPQVAKLQSEITRMRTMLQTGRHVEPADGRSTGGMKTGDVLTKEQLANVSKKLEQALNELATITRSQVKTASTAIDKLYAEMASVLGVSKPRFQQATSSWQNFQAAMDKANAYEKWKKENTTYTTQTMSTGSVIRTANYNDSKNPYRDWAWVSRFKDDGERWQRLTQEIQNRESAKSTLYSQYGQAYRRINRAEGVNPYGSTGSGKTATEKTETELKQNEAAVAKLTEEYQKLATDAKTANEAQLSGIKERQSAIQTEIANLKARNEELKKFAAEAQGIQVNIGINSSLPDLTAKLKELQAAQSQALNGTEWQEYQKQIEQVSLQIDAMKGKWKDGMKATISVNAESIQKAIGESSKLQDLIIKPKKQTSPAAVESNANNVAADASKLEDVITKPKKGTATIDSNIKEVEADASKLEDVITKPKTGKVTITADTTDAKAKVGEVGEMVGDKTAKVTFTADNAEVLQKAAKVEGVQIDPKTLTVTAITTEAEDALRNIEGLTLQPKELDITADVQKVLDAITQIDGVTVDPKTLEITAGTAEAYAKLQELFANIEGTTVSFYVEPKQREMETGVSITNAKGMSSYISQLKSDLAEADFGSDIYNSIAAKLTDMTSLSNLVAESLKAGLGTSMFDAADILGKDFWTRAMEGGVEDIDWQGIVDKINEKLKEMDLKPISLDFETGNVTVDGKNQDTKAASGKDNMSQLINNVHTMTRCLEDMGIEVPAGFTKVISSMNLVTTILQTIQSLTTASSAIGKGGGIIGLVGSLFSSIFGGFFAGGGLVPHAANGMVVPGNDHMDRTLIAASSGELILNAAQQNTVAGLLTQAPAANMGRTEAYIESDQIRICLLNGAQAKGMTLGQYLGIGG